MSLPGVKVKVSAKHESPKKPKLNREDMIVESESDDGLTMEDIIEDKPPTKIVREFFKQNLASIKSEEEVMFEGKS